MEEKFWYEIQVTGPQLGRPGEWVPSTIVRLPPQADVKDVRPWKAELRRLRANATSQCSYRLVRLDSSYITTVTQVLDDTEIPGASVSLSDIRPQLTVYVKGRSLSFGITKREERMLRDLCEGESA